MAFHNKTHEYLRRCPCPQAPTSPSRNLAERLNCLNRPRYSSLPGAPAAAAASSSPTLVRCRRSKHSSCPSSPAVANSPWAGHTPAAQRHPAKAYKHSLYGIQQPERLGSGFRGSSKQPASGASKQAQEAALSMLMKGVESSGPNSNWSPGMSSYELQGSAPSTTPFSAAQPLCSLQPCRSPRPACHLGCNLFMHCLSPARPNPVPSRPTPPPSGRHRCRAQPKSSRARPPPRRFPSTPLGTLLGTLLGTSASAPLSASRPRHPSRHLALTAGVVGRRGCGQRAHEAALRQVEAVHLVGAARHQQLGGRGEVGQVATELGHTRAVVGAWRRDRVGEGVGLGVGVGARGGG